MEFKVIQINTNLKPSKKMKIVTTIVTSMYNRKQEVLEIIDKLFFPSLLRNSNKNTELIIIDDCSPLKIQTDILIHKYLPELRKAFGSVKYTTNKENLGFAKSYNVGIQMAKGKNLLIANDDLYFPIGSINKLIDTLSESKDCGLVGPISNTPMMWSFQYCKQAPRLKSYSTEEIGKIEEFSIWLSEKMSGKRTMTDHHLCGFCFASKTNFMKEFGGFNENYGYGNLEDTDLIYRILHKYGKERLVINNEVFIGHGGIKGNSRTLLQQPLRMICHMIINSVIFSYRWGLKKYFKIVYFGIKSQLNGTGTISELLPNIKF